MERARRLASGLPSPDLDLSGKPRCDQRRDARDLRATPGAPHAEAPFLERRPPTVELASGAIGDVGP